MKAIRRESLAIALVLLHLFVVPCAPAMMLMSADADCEHCLTADSVDACLLTSAAAGLTMENLAFDSGHAERALAAVKILSDMPAAQLAARPATSISASRLSYSATRITGAPPLYLLLGQLRI